MLVSALLAAALIAPAADPAKPFEFKDGDRIVWIGNTLVEREQRYGYWETALIAANADKNITMRNLGWSGDTVFGEARGRFDFNNSDVCFRQLVNQTLAITTVPASWVAPVERSWVNRVYEFKPTVIFVSYGTNESFEGKEGLPRFEKGLEKLLDALKPANARIVLFTPMRFEESKEFPYSKKRNQELNAYAEVIQKVGRGRKLPVADLFSTSFLPFLVAGGITPPCFLTDNGMHLNEGGYRELAETVLFSLEWSAFPTPPEKKQNQLMLDWKKLEPLRHAVIAKNELFFHQWRPQNETYLFGFRQHEQGNNANEVVVFNPLIAKAEEEIAKLRKELKK